METDPQLVPSVVSVMVVHEPGDWFDETLRSLAAQDYPNFRSLFLVTAVADELAEITERIQAVLPDAFVRGLPANVGFGPSVNEVLKLVEGDNGFFLVCHDDVALEPRTVRLLVAELFRSNAGVVGPKLVDWDRPRVLQHVGLGLDRFGELDPLVEPGEVDQEQHDAVRDVFVLPSACLLIRADLMRALGGFDPTMSFHGEDVDLCWRAHLTGARVVVAPDARVRHRERLVERRPDLNHRALRSRHRMRSVATLTGGSRLLGRSLQLIVLTVVEIVVGLFSGRFGEAMSSLRALLGLLPRTPSIVTRRRAIRGQRMVPEREVLGLQDRGSSRLTSYLRGKDTATYVGADTTVRRWRERSFGPPLAWFCVILAVVIGSRSFIRNGVPAVGEMLPFPESPRQLLSDFRSSFDPRGFGSTAANPTGYALLAFSSVAALFRMGLLQTLSVVGLVLLGALGAWRLVTVFPVSRARVAGMIVYVGAPFVPGLLSRGDLSGLVWFASLPWLLHLVRRAAGLETADPSAADVDLPDGVAPVTLRVRVRSIAFASLVLGATAAYVPVTVVLFAAVGLLVAVATLLAGGAWRVSAWLAAATVTTVASGALLNLPWTLDWRWATLVGPPNAAQRTDWWELASLTPTSTRFGVLALALYLPVLATLAIARAWRLTWGARGAALVLGFGAVLLLADRGAIDIATPKPSLLAAPILLGLALNAAALVGGFGTDVSRRGFGWRQPFAVLANVAIVVGLVPGLLSIGDGAWHTPSTPITSFLESQLPAEVSEGDYRVLYIGDPRLLPVPGHEYQPGIAYAVVDAGPLDVTDRFPTVTTPGDEAVERALRLISTGATLRAGRLLAPLGIRYVVIPETDGVYSTSDHPIPLPEGLVAAIQNQLDIGLVPGPPALEVFANESWIPVGAQLTGATAEASKSAGDEVIVRSDLTEALPSMRGVDGEPQAANQVAPGAVHLAIPFDDRLTLTVDGTEVEGRPSFGVVTAFDTTVGGTGVVGYRQDGSRSMWLAVVAVLWFAVLITAAGAHASFSRRRGFVIYDETLIDLDEQPTSGRGVVGEVLGLPTWGDAEIADADDDDDDDRVDAEHADDGMAWLVTEQAGGERSLQGHGGVPLTGRADRRPDEPPRFPRQLIRDTTPPGGVPRIVAGSPRPELEDEVDLAGLVARVDDEAGDDTAGGERT